MNKQNSKFNTFFDDNPILNALMSVVTEGAAFYSYCDDCLRIIRPIGSYCDLFGYADNDEAVKEADKVLTLTDKDDAENLKKHIDEAIKTHTEQKLSVKRYRKDGGYCCVDLRLSCVAENENESIIFILFYSKNDNDNDGENIPVDIKILISAFHEVSIINTKELTYTVVHSVYHKEYINQSMPLLDTFNNKVLPTVHDDDRQGFTECFMHYVKNKSVESTSFVFRINAGVKSNGWARSIFIPFKDGFYICNRDITNEQQSHTLYENQNEIDERRRNENQYHYIAEQANLAVCEYNFKTGNMYYSPAFHEYEMVNFKYRKKGDTEGFAKYVHPEDINQFMRFLGGSSETNMSDKTEIRLKTADGNYRWCVLSICYIRNSLGETCRFIIRIDDFSEEMAIRRELIRTNEKLTEQNRREKVILSSIEALNSKINDNEAFPEMLSIIRKYYDADGCCVMLADTETLIGEIKFNSKKNDEPLNESVHIINLKTMPDLAESLSSCGMICLSNIDSLNTANNAEYKFYKDLGMKNLYAYCFDLGNTKRGSLFVYNAKVHDDETDILLSVNRLARNRLAKWIAAMELRDMAEQQQNIHDSIPGALFIYAPGEKKNLVYMSSGWQRLTGYSYEESISLNTKVISSEYFKTASSIITKAIELKQPYEYILKTKHRNGRTIYLDVKARPIVEADGSIRYYGFVTDITAQQEQKIELMDIKGRLDIAVKMSDLSVWEYDIKNSRIVQSAHNSRTAGGPDVYENVPQSLISGNHYHPFSIRAVIDMFERLKKGEKEIEEEVQVWDDKTKNYWWEKIHYLNIFDINGKPVKAVAVGRDVTTTVEKEQQKNRELNNALDAARQATSAKSDFLSRISHEIRTPMNAIIGMTALAQDALTSGGDVSSHLSKIHASSSYLLSLINDILDMSKIESKKIEFHPQIINLQETMGEITSIVQPLLEQKNIRLNISVNDFDYKYCLVDKMRVEQVLINLLSNAIKFSDDGGEIELVLYQKEVKEEKLCIEIKVKDYGVGISDEFKKKIFTPFAQERNTKTASIQGTGLGLAICKNLLTQMGGSISVESSLGEGSEFTVNIITGLVSNDVLVDGKKAQIPENFSFNGKRVLLCDDNELNVEIAQNLLENRGLEVECAYNGADALSLYREKKAGYFDCILMDIQMPVMDGLSATRMIRLSETADAKSIPIVAMTANAFDEDVRKSLSAGMNAHLSKPINPKNLFEQLYELIYTDNSVQADRGFAVHYPSAT